MAPIPTRPKSRNPRRQRTVKVTALLALAILASACVRLISLSPAPDSGSSVDNGSLRQDGIPIHDGEDPKADRGNDRPRVDGGDTMSHDLLPAHDSPQVTHDLTPALDHPQVTNDLTPALDHPQADTTSPSVPWLANARLRRAIEIATTNPNPLTNFQVLVHLDTQALIQRKVLSSGCGDLAFTDSDGTTVLPYWIEGGCNSADTRIWVKIPRIAAQSSQAFVNYGFVSTLPPGNGSDGSAVFLFFDDFDGGLGQWTGFGSPLPKTVAEASCHDGWAYTTNGDLNYASGSFSKTLLDLTHGVVIEARIRQLAGAGPWDMLYGFALGAAASGYTDRNIPLLASVRVNGTRPDAHPEQT
ncbi:MAG: DUF2341 domain-containing protein, partial [Deltaproteobacteria bacterium]|nr:DUF2341 domain-containing protein [Deltaproteobacteria bacterium]